MRVPPSLGQEGLQAAPLPLGQRQGHQPVQPQGLLMPGSENPALAKSRSMPKTHPSVADADGGDPPPDMACGSPQGGMTGEEEEEEGAASLPLNPKT